MASKRPTKNRDTSLLKKEKEQLKDAIMASMYSYDRKIKYLKRSSFGLVAATAIIFGINLYISNSEPSIESYIKTVKNVDSKNFETVKLVLSDTENVDIAEDNSTISYSNTGQQVTIGNAKSIQQKVSKNNEVTYNTIVVPYGKRSKLELSDGSQVWLNSGSKLVYPVIFHGNKREVYLEGEAIFEAAHNKSRPFIVKAEDHEIEVLGTVFNVSNYLDEKNISTTLKSGSIQINYKSDSFFETEKSVKIKPGAKAVYNRTEQVISSKQVDVANYFSWRDGVFIFKNDDMAFIMKRLSRYYNVNIEIKNTGLKGQTFSGYLDLKEDVENVIGIIKETADFEYNIEENETISIN